MNTIYEPKGRAYEYSKLALNLYNGCEHGCLYCFAQKQSRKTRESFMKVYPRKGILEALEKCAKNMAGDSRRILMCFTSDPYTPVEDKLEVTKKALEILGENNMRAQILTKNGPLAIRDIDLWLKHDTAFASTILLNKEKDIRELEPWAADYEDRKEAVRIAHGAGVKTWVSIEPVIYPNQVFEILEDMKGIVDHWKIGKINHDKAKEGAVNWGEFLGKVLRFVTANNLSYYIKNDLWEFASGNMKADFLKGVRVPD